jgi:hypothetical protein
LRRCASGGGAGSRRCASVMTGACRRRHGHGTGDVEGQAHLCLGGCGCCPLATGSRSIRLGGFVDGRRCSPPCAGPCSSAGSHPVLPARRHPTRGPPSRPSAAGRRGPGTCQRRGGRRWRPRTALQACTRTLATRKANESGTSCWVCRWVLTAPLSALSAAVIALTPSMCSVVSGQSGWEGGRGLLAQVRESHHTHHAPHERSPLVASTPCFKVHSRRCASGDTPVAFLSPSSTRCSDPGAAP